MLLALGGVHLALLLPASRLSAVRMPHQSVRMAAGPQADAEKWIEEHHGKISKSSGLGGSGWASFSRVSTADREFFVKTSSKNCEQMFYGEALGLRAMHATNTIKIPEVLHFGDSESGSGSYIIMDFLPLGGRADQKVFGRRMAEMHLATPAAKEAQEGKFGFDVTNTCGGTTQPNAWREDWVDFFREQRIGHQVRTAGDASLKKLWAEVLVHTDELRALFEGVEVKPSVLHGDLWSGNVAAVEGEPCIFDPATYYGHHEAEWGMSWCASLGPAFWEGYRELIPEDPGFRKREALYELYHKLNHYNLFGGGYKWESESLMNALMRE